MNIYEIENTYIHVSVRIFSSLNDRTARAELKKFTKHMDEELKEHFVVNHIGYYDPEEKDIWSEDIYEVERGGKEL